MLFHHMQNNIFYLLQRAGFTGRINESHTSSLRTRIVAGSERASDSAEGSSLGCN